MKTSADAYCSIDGGAITIGTAQVEKRLVLTDDGRFLLDSFTDKASGKELRQNGAIPSDEFTVTVDGVQHRGSSVGWRLAGWDSAILGQGELEAVVRLENDCLGVERHYVAYPGTGVIQEWTVYLNKSNRPVKVTRPSLFVQRLLAEDAAALDFHYMTGGANFTGSCTLKTVPVTDGLTRDFDSRGEPEMVEIDGKYINEWHPRMNGTGVWFEFFALRHRESGLGFFLNFDYQGWWKAGFTNRDGSTALTGWCELLELELAPGQELRIAPMMCGVCHGDLDDMGNAIGNYIYRYKWDYTRDTYFNRTNLSIWRSAPLTEKVFQMVEVARYVGYERVWVDDFWFDAKGNYNNVFGDDFRQVNDYLKRNGLLFRLWMPPWHADRLSQVWVEHPDWMLDFHGNWYNWTIDLSKEEAYRWVLDMLHQKQEQFGAYDLRVDGDPCNMWNDGSFDTADGNWNGNHKQSENFYRLYREFKEQNPDAGLDGCSSGGHTLTIESVRYVDQQQITDGRCEHMGGYWTTMLMPVDKHQGMPMGGERRRDWNHYDPGRANLFSAPGGSMQNPELGWDVEALEGYRKELELFYWLRNQGVYGRGVKVYRPTLTYGDPTFLLQRMTEDGGKGLLLISGHRCNPILGKPAHIFPKGLHPDREYRIETLRGGMEPETRTGRQWMEEGIALSTALPAECLLLGLPGRPGQGSDTEPPTTPAFAHKEQAAWLGHEGMGVTWGESTDNVMVSYYQLSKNGEALTKVSTGLYYFDTEGTPADTYTVCAVDGDGNRSGIITAEAR